MGRDSKIPVRNRSDGAAMLYLKTFGGLSVTMDGAPGTGAGQQRKMLALLALLAAAGRRGASRDKLIAYLWPETDARRGRGLLKQACYALRHDLGAPELFVGSTELRLNPVVISSDVESFEDALEQHDLARAVSLHTAPFLDGFYLNGEGDFERWVESERARFTKRTCDALETLASAASSRGEHREAVERWRRFAEIDPLSSRAVLGLMTALDDLGERAEALKRGRAYKTLVREELEADPPSEVAALIRRLHHQSGDGDRPYAISAPPVIGGGAGEILPALPATLVRRMHRAHTLSLIAVAGVVVLAGGTIFALLGRRAARNASDPVLPGRKMLAVLPFENLGSPTDEYLADGLTEAIATRLGSIQRLGVIAWPSASQYKHTNKSPQQIGRELGVQYILAGSVQWDKRSDSSRIRVSPSLIRVSDAAHLWGAQYDTTLSGVFAIQTSLATRVAGALDIALMDAERRLLEARQTTNLQAYDLYLRGRELVDREFVARANVQTAVDLYERAVALDSNFAVAYAWLSVGCVWLRVTYFDRSPKLLARAKTALDRALRLAPDLPESHAALGFYYFNVLGDYEKALKELLEARRSRRNDPYFAAVIADIYTKQGRWNDALVSGQEGAALDPLNVYLASGPALAYAELRQFTPAIYYYDRALALRPRSFEAQLGKALAYLSSTGDLSSAQRLLPDLSQPVDPSGHGVPIFSLSDVATLLDAEQQVRLLNLSPAAMDGDSIVLALSKGLVLRTNARVLEARTQFDSARTILERMVRQDPNDDYYAALLGLALAGLGRTADAIHEGERAVALVPVSKDAEWSGYLRANLARIYVMVNEPVKAIEQLEIVLSRPGPLSAGWLRADPFWDPLQANPRFRRLVAARH